MDKLKTVAVLIGNSDDKLTQREWSDYAFEIKEILYHRTVDLHFCGASFGASEYQNACFVLELHEEELDELKQVLSKVGKVYNQDSIAFVVGNTTFI